MSRVPPTFAKPPVNLGRGILLEPKKDPNAIEIPQRINAGGVGIALTPEVLTAGKEALAKDVLITFKDHLAEALGPVFEGLEKLAATPNAWGDNVFILRFTLDGEFGITTGAQVREMAELEAKEASA